MYVRRSVGIKDPSNALVAEIKDASHHNLITEMVLKNILTKHVPSLKESWPAHSDVVRAFRVFDTEGVGFIKVTMLKRFLVQAQLEVDETVCEYLCMWGLWGRVHAGCA
jgi:Ca2+-binding EF-hand superfamily protein